MGLITGTYRVKTRVKVYVKDTYQNIRRKSPPTPNANLAADTETTPNPFRLQRLKFEVQTVLWPHWIRRPFREHIKENDFSYFKECGELVWFATYSLPEDQTGKHLKKSRMHDEAWLFKNEMFEDEGPESLDHVEEWLFEDGLRFYG